MMERSESLGRKELKEVYRPLARWTEWWLACRDSDGDGVPQYNHGNDSGWDNATVFDGGVPVEGPDLSAYLVVQMDCLAEIAGALDKKGEGKRWRKQADELLKRLFKHSWRGDRFVAPRSGDHAVSAGDSLLPYLPIVLGKRLPSEVRSALVAGLTAENRFLTDNGLATESVSSPLHEPEGYWRGPIWAPSTLIVVDGLTASGERGLARRIASRFCDMVARSGMAENFEARSGAGLCDRAYTWTASVFQVLAHEYL
jgi:glycogen debranching enzyme